MCRPARRAVAHRAVRLARGHGLFRRFGVLLCLSGAKDAPRYGHCGFAVGSVLAIVRSFFLVENVGLGLVVVYAVLVSCLLGALGMTALSDPGM